MILCTLDISVSNSEIVSCSSLLLISQTGAPPLKLAAKTGNIKLIEYLISKGADYYAVDKVKGIFSCRLLSIVTKCLYSYFIHHLRATAI